MSSVSFVKNVLKNVTRQKLNTHFMQKQMELEHLRQPYEKQAYSYYKYYPLP